MDMTYPAEAEVFRAEVRKVLAEELPADWRGIGAIPTEAETEDFVARWRAVLHRRGLLGITWPVEYGGRGLSQLHQVVLVEELTRAGLPFGRQPLEATGLKMLGNTLLRWGTDDQKARYLPGLLSGEIRFCQGFSEPSAGSDLASVRTRALRRGGDWVINGQKIWTSAAMHSTHIFTLVRTDPDAPKHRGLTFLLVPLAQPGVEVRPIRHMAGGREFCEIFFTDARTGADEVVGQVNGGWAVLRGALDVEHGTGEGEADGLQRIAVMSEHATLMAEAIDTIAALVTHEGADGRRLLDDESVAYRLGRSVARTEAALSTPGMFGRVANAQTMRDVAPDLMDVLGTASALPVDTHGAADDGGAEYIFRLASPTGIYGGTLEVFRNMIAQHALGLGRPNYSPPVS